MNAFQLRYLQAINQQLGGPIRAAIPDKMTSYLLDCVFSISTRVVVDIELGDQTRDALKKELETQCPALKPVLGATDAGQALLAEVEKIIGAGDTGEGINSLAARVAAYLMRQATPESLRLAQGLVAADADNWQRIQSESDRIRDSATQRVEREVDAMTREERERLLALLRRECGEPTRLAIKEIFAVPGGYSKQTIIVTLENNQHLPRQIVVRRDRAESPVGTSVADELELLRLLFDAGLKVPKPWVLDQGNVMSTPIMVVSKIEGHNIGDVYTVREKNERYALDLADELAKLHTIPLSRLRADMPGNDIANLDYMRRELDEFHGHWQQTGERSIAMDAGEEWLQAHIDWADGPRSLIHRDPRFHNILCHDGEMTALLDWELAMVGNPARDLGWAYHQVVQLIEWDKFLARYAASGGPYCSPQSLAFYAMWSDWYCAVQMFRARVGFHSGQAPFAYAYAGEEMRQQNVNIVAQRLRQVMAKGSLE